MIQWRYALVISTLNQLLIKFIDSIKLGFDTKTQSVCFADYYSQL